MLTHHNMVSNALYVGDAMEMDEHDRLCIPVPFYHCFGCVMGSLNCVVHGSTMIIPSEHFDPLQTLRAISTERCTAVHGVPTMFIRSARPSRLCPVRPRLPADRHHGRFPLSHRGYARGHRPHGRRPHHHRLRPDRGLTGRDPDPRQRQYRASCLHRGQGSARRRGQAGRPRDRPRGRPGSAGRAPDPQHHGDEELLQHAPGYRRRHRRRRLGCTPATSPPSTRTATTRSPAA